MRKWSLKDHDDVFQRYVAEEVGFDAVYRAILPDFRRRAERIKRHHRRHVAISVEDIAQIMVMAAWRALDTYDASKSGGMPPCVRVAFLAHGAAISLTRCSSDIDGEGRRGPSLDAPRAEDFTERERWGGSTAGARGLAAPDRGTCELPELVATIQRESDPRLVDLAMLAVRVRAESLEDLELAVLRSGSIRRKYRLRDADDVARWCRSVRVRAARTGALDDLRGE